MSFSFFSLYLSTTEERLYTPRGHRKVDKTTTNMTDKAEIVDTIDHQYGHPSKLSLSLPHLLDEIITGDSRPKNYKGTSFLSLCACVRLRFIHATPSTPPPPPPLLIRERSNASMKTLNSYDDDG